MTIVRVKVKKAIYEWISIVWCKELKIESRLWFSSGTTRTQRKIENKKWSPRNFSKMENRKDIYNSWIQYTTKVNNKEDIFMMFIFAGRMFSCFVLFVGCVLVCWHLWKIFVLLFNDQNNVFLYPIYYYRCDFVCWNHSSYFCCHSKCISVLDDDYLIHCILLSSIQSNIYFYFSLRLTTFISFRIARYIPFSLALSPLLCKQNIKCSHFVQWSYVSVLITY